ncbi:MAG: prenyltransferase [Paludibacteraceae bacterium]|nr:prenyltransferase [Paludibacteraceae bacterium]
MDTQAVFNQYYRGHHKGLFFWIRNSRAIALPQSALPALLAIAMCANEEGFVWWLAVVAMLGVMIGHLGMNLADDYYDFCRDSRIRSTLSASSVRARMDKCSYITNGDASIDDLRKAMIRFLAIAGLLGLTVVAGQWYMHGWRSAVAPAVYALLGLGLGIGYSGKPLQLCMHGLGEPVIGVMFGPLLMLGMQAAVCGRVLSLPVAGMGVAVGLLVTNILYVHSVMEVQADGELDKMTLARLLYREDRKPETVMAGVFAMLPYMIICAGIVLHWWSIWMLLTLLTLPMSVYLIYSLYRFVHGLPTRDVPQWWMGPMTEFKIFQDAGMDWFLIRWLLARNIVMYFCIIAMVVSWL